MFAAVVTILLITCIPAAMFGMLAFWIALPIAIVGVGATALLTDWFAV
jgi:hypothetical protein